MHEGATEEEVEGWCQKEMEDYEAEAGSSNSKSPLQSYPWQGSVNVCSLVCFCSFLGIINRELLNSCE